MSLFSRNTDIAIDRHPKGWRVVKKNDRDDQYAGKVFSSRNDAKSQRRLEHKVATGKTPRWAR
jgi:hypothetical protein